MKHLIQSIVSILLLLLAGIIQAQAQAQSHNVAAASDLKFAIEQIGVNFHKVNSQPIKLIFGSSGLLTQQAMNGAPFGMLMSADEQMIDQLHKAGKTEDAGQMYAIGRIVLMQKKDSALRISADKADLMKAIKRAKKIAIANPEHAPYGRAAKEYLQTLGLWEIAEPKLVYGENISQATTYVLTGAADFGISALSLALSPQLKSISSFVLIPEELHRPLRQKMVLLKGATPSVKAFYGYLQEPVARQVMSSYGFVLP
ncbi:molybdate ABC transporter substrate-binding protein [Polynucleobacter sp. TUM22923]|jgi:molybdate transport system substrate-binding protein|uniref:molybdate ABC transporter substrate-binding protein n=1 Tax=Polynucleobacter sp. TUM22923 TaxID=3022126 RepID=UPI0025724BF3|nr:molybdate ABC transporter substrate-binding protein [Polynucleobacter sp. TUM22923]BDX22037.1 molybdate ABC transporter substrate-binding protein [Polynucleobacter sp. TUM22923]